MMNYYSRYSQLTIICLYSQSRGRCFFSSFFTGRLVRGITTGVFYFHERTARLAFLSVVSSLFAYRLFAFADSADIVQFTILQCIEFIKYNYWFFFFHIPHTEYSFFNQHQTRPINLISVSFFNNIYSSYFYYIIVNAVVIHSIALVNGRR